MRLRGSLFIGTVVATVGAPFAALAGQLTTAPVGPAPAIGMPMLVLLALALSVGAVYVLRRKAASATVRLAVLAAAIILAGIAYADIPGVVVSGVQCTVRTTQSWTDSIPYALGNQCPNSLRIEAIVNTCPNPDVPPSSPCVVGQILAPGAICRLPFCV